jgi:hypothetical protein
MLLGLVACVPPAGEQPDAIPGGAAGEDAVRGVLRVAGSQPVNVQVMLDNLDGSGLIVDGPMRDELRQLSGAEVVVYGRIEGEGQGPGGRRIAAADYEIVAINGEPVVMGTVQNAMNDWTVLRTRSGELVYLSSAPDGLQAGQKVWVQGPRSVVVQSYGVVRR